MNTSIRGILTAAAIMLTLPSTPSARLPQTAAAPTPAQGDSLARLADEVAKEVEGLRGWKFKRPVRKARISLPDARRDIRNMLLSSEPPDRRARVQAVLRVAGLIPPDCDLLATSLAVLEQQVAGYYEPRSRTLKLVDRATPMPAFVQRMILSHELTHALDDQHIDLEKLMRPGATEDADFVATSLGEGSATALMLQEMVAAQKSGRFNMADLSLYVAEELERARTLEELPRYFSAMFGSYILGAAFLAKGELPTLLTMPDDREIGRNLLIARRALPRSSEQILHAEKYWDPARRDEPVLIDDRAVERWLARRGRFVVHRDTLGELLTAILTEPKGAPRELARLQSTAAWTNPGAEGWGGDRFYLLAAGTSQEDAARSLKGLQGVWVTAWDSLKERDEFLAALEKGSPPPGAVAAPVEGRVAVVFIGIDPAERRALTGRLNTAPLLMTKDGRPWTGY